MNPTHPLPHRPGTTTITVRSDLLDDLGGLSYKVVDEDDDGFSTLEVTWSNHARILSRLSARPDT